MVNGAQVDIAENVRYLTYGPVSRWTYGNGAVRVLGYDEDFRLTNIGTSGIQGLTHNYNANNLITSITNSVNSAGTQSYGYDVLSRLRRLCTTAQISDNVTTDPRSVV